MEQNTNRMWWTIGIIVLGGLLLGGVSVLAQEGILPKISTDMTDMFYRSKLTPPAWYH